MVTNMKMSATGKNIQHCNDTESPQIYLCVCVLNFIYNTYSNLI